MLNFCSCCLAIKTADGAIAVDDTMARNRGSVRVRFESLADGLGAVAVERLGNSFVGCDFSSWDIFTEGIYALCEWCWSHFYFFLKNVMMRLSLFGSAFLPSV